MPSTPASPTGAAGVLAASPGGAAPAGVAAADSIVDDAQAAAAGTRQAAKWFASALAAVPALGIVGSLIKGPGSAGFDPLLLLFGLALGVAGAFVGIYFFSRVFTPIPLEDAQIDPATDLSRLPGQPFASYQALKVALDRGRIAFSQNQYASVRANVFAASAGKLAADAEAYAKQLEAETAYHKDDNALKQRAEQARLDADQKRLAAAAAAATAAAAAEQVTTWINQVQGLEKIRTQLFHLKASDVVGKRFREAQRGAIFAAVLVTFGVFLVAVAPRQSASSPSNSSINLHVTFDQSTPSPRNR
jgi:hypothetical protein